MAAKLEDWLMFRQVHRVIKNFNEGGLKNVFRLLHSS